MMIALRSVVTVEGKKIFALAIGKVKLLLTTIGNTENISLVSLVL